MTNLTQNELKLIWAAAEKAGEEMQQIAEEKLLSFPSSMDWETVRKFGEEIQRIAKEAQDVPNP